MKYLLIMFILFFNAQSMEHTKKRKYTHNCFSNDTRIYINPEESRTIEEIITLVRSNSNYQNFLRLPMYSFFDDTLQSIGTIRESGRLFKKYRKERFVLIYNSYHHINEQALILVDQTNKRGLALIAYRNFIRQKNERRKQLGSPFV